MKRSPLRIRARAVVGGALVVLALAGCGQKGSLYLPDKPKDVVTRPGPAPAASPAPGATSPPQSDPQSAPPTAPERRDDDSRTSTPKR